MSSEEFEGSQPVAVPTPLNPRVPSVPLAIKFFLTGVEVRLPGFPSIYSAGLRLRRSAVGSSFCHSSATSGRGLLNF